MPLPSNTSLSLLGYSRPGDALQSKPKQAMLVRLSSEILDTLESFSSHPQVQFEFGENPGLYVGEEHFPLRHSSENTIHELFLRASSVSKKSAPLKLHANVVGKFAVERELADQLRDKIRESTLDAANQRNSRSTVFIETPPDLQTNSRKRKDPPSSMFRKPIRPLDKSKASTSSGQYAASQSPSTSQSKDVSGGARKRIIQYLALNNEASEEKLLQIANISDRNVSPTRHLAELLDQIADVTSVKAKSTEPSAKHYRLKPVTWKEVRPFEWPALSEQEQMRIARQARSIFQQSLKIPENDPIWDHVRYKNTSSSSFAHTDGSSSTDPRRGSTTSIPPFEDVARSRGSDTHKRGLSSRDAKEKKSKQRSDFQGEIMMKDESSRTTATSKTATPHEKLQNVSDPRRVPNVSAADSVVGRTHVSLAPKPMRALTSQIDKELGKPLSSKAKVGQSRQTEKNTPSNNSKIPLESAQEDKISRVKRTQQPESSKVNGMVDGGRDNLKSSSLKRKMDNQLDDELYDPPLVSNPTKRPKSDYSDSPSRKDELAKKEARQIDRQAPKKAQTSSFPKSRKTHDSPPPPPQTKRQTIPSSREPDGVSFESLSKSQSTHTAGYQGAKSTGSTKLRRPPVYTSSEDDESPPSGHNPGNVLSDKKGPPHSRISNSKALPTDHGALRARYNSSYLEYLSVFQRLVVEKGKNDSLLSKDLANTDSDGDADLMDPDELAKLVKTHNELRDELERIQSIFG